MYIVYPTRKTVKTNYTIWPKLCFCLLPNIYIILVVNCYLSFHSGHDCEFNVDECLSNPCQNNGTCMDFTNGFTCQCPAGYVGKFLRYSSSVEVIFYTFLLDQNINYYK